uniref:FBD domain-containing protein n=1 Tax=Quercus lobata TaxID=97700 RepID=A0A7N2MF80_QUELO
MEKRVRLTAKCSKNKGKCASKDYISNLSSETLVSILSQLTLREAVATSILGRRWRISFDLDQNSTHAINSWIEFAMTREVQRLEMDLLGQRPYNTLSSRRCSSKCKRLWRSQSCGSSREQFCLNLLSARTPTFHGNKFLKDLYLKNVGITQEVIEYLLANCPKLERLSICGSRHLYAGLDIDLFIENVPLLVDLYIGVGKGNLDRPFLDDYLSQFSGCLSQLQVLTLELIDGFVDEVYSEFFPPLNNLKKLVLEVGAWGEDHLLGLTPLINACPYLQILELKLLYVLALAYSPLPVVKIDDLTISSAGISVESCLNPSFDAQLKENMCLACEMPWINVEDHDRRKMRGGIKCPHKYLKVLEIYGYAGRTCEFEFVMYFIRNAVALEKILIDPRDQIVKRTPFASANLKIERTARRLAKSQLEARVPPSIQLVILTPLENSVGERIDFGDRIWIRCKRAIAPLVIILPLW